MKKYRLWALCIERWIKQHQNVKICNKHYIISMYNQVIIVQISTHCHRLRYHLYYILKIGPAALCVCSEEIQTSTCSSQNPIWQIFKRNDVYGDAENYTVCSMLIAILTRNQLKTRDWFLHICKRDCSWCLSTQQSR